MLVYEIEKAIDTYNLPLICAYTGYDSIYKPRELASRWPTALVERINNTSAKAIHIPFNKNALLDAIGQFTVHTGKPKGSLEYYSQEAHAEFGCK